MEKPPHFQFSPEITKELQETERIIQAAKKRVRELMPLCPDGSEEQGVFDTDSQETLKEMSRESERRMEKLRALRPIAPEESGEQGIYDEVISHVVRRPAFRTESGKLFYKVEGGYAMLDGKLLEKVKEHIEKYKI
ncbi:MAG TPA: hypothetical protein VKC53_03800 [Patescibacteria group bacterium]|nr:hypothetical protein [Patescibacteria group bacterium]